MKLVDIENKNEYHRLVVGLSPSESVAQSKGLIDMKDLFNPAVDINLSEKEMNKIHNIMFSWFHPLKNEWYPYLHNLKNWGKK